MVLPIFLSCIVEKAEREKWDTFWNAYFMKFWMSLDECIAPGILQMEGKYAII